MWQLSKSLLGLINLFYAYFPQLLFTFNVFFKSRWEGKGKNVNQTRQSKSKVKKWNTVPKAVREKE